MMEHFLVLNRFHFYSFPASVSPLVVVAVAPFPLQKTATVVIIVNVAMILYDISFVLWEFDRMTIRGKLCWHLHHITSHRTASVFVCSYIDSLINIHNKHKIVRVDLLLFRCEYSWGTKEHTHSENSEAMRLRHFAEVRTQLEMQYSNTHQHSQKNGSSNIHVKIQQNDISSTTSGNRTQKWRAMFLGCQNACTCIIKKGDRGVLKREHERRVLFAFEKESRNPIS